MQRLRKALTCTKIVIKKVLFSKKTNLESRMTSIVEKRRFIRWIVVGLKNEPASRFALIFFLAYCYDFRHIFAVSYDYLANLRKEELRKGGFIYVYRIFTTGENEINRRNHFCLHQVILRAFEIVALFENVSRQETKPVGRVLAQKPLYNSNPSAIKVESFIYSQREFLLSHSCKNSDVTDEGGRSELSLTVFHEVNIYKTEYFEEIEVITRVPWTKSFSKRPGHIFKVESKKQPEIHISRVNNSSLAIFRYDARTSRESFIKHIEQNNIAEINS